VVAGLEAYHQTVSSSRRRIDSVAGTVQVDPNGRFPDGAVYSSFGVFVQDECEVGDGCKWTNGLRWSACHTDFDLGGLTVGPAGPFGELSETFEDWTFATALSVRLDKQTYAYGSFSKGFRAPNLDDLAVVGDFASGERVPNLDVKPETVLVPEIGVKHRSARFRGECCTAIAFYEDLLDTVFAFNQGGVDYFVVDNVGRATIWSVEMGGAWVAVESDGLLPEHSVYAQAFSNVGYNDTANEPVSKVPPPQAELGWRLDAADGSWFVQAYSVVALSQHRLSAADLADPRFSKDGTSGWWTVNVRGGLPLDDRLRLTMALENIFDQRYRVHGSGIDAPGFNAVVQMEVEF
jgi:outer membrane receptor protein involved in Fe transport